MEMQQINAGKLRAIGYDARLRVLQVRLDDGSTLQYSGVGVDIWRRLSSSGAAWSYCRDNIAEEFTAQRITINSSSVSASNNPPAKNPPAKNPLDDLFRKN